MKNTDSAPPHTRSPFPGESLSDIPSESPLDMNTQAPFPAEPQNHQTYSYPTEVYILQPTTNRLAMKALTLALVSLLGSFTMFPMLLGPVAAWLGSKALEEAERNNESGRGMAIAATIIGWLVSIVVMLAIIGAVLVFLYNSMAQKTVGNTGNLTFEEFG